MFSLFNKKVNDNINVKTNIEVEVSKYVKQEYNWELDIDKMVDASTFPIAPNDLINRCKEVIDNDFGLLNEDDLSESFQFIFPVVGPLTKTEYLDTLKKFNLTEMFTKIKEGLFYNFYVDPYQHNRVWFTTRLICKNDGDGFFGKATNKIVNCPPQSISLTFDQDGKVILYTGGYVMDKTIGNTGGLGGVFGILYAIGKPLPFPEAQPYRKSFKFSLCSSFQKFFS